MQQTWTASTIFEALNILEAATKQLEAQSLALEPGDFAERKKVERNTPIRLTVDFDLTNLAQQVTTKHTIRRES
ncbi:hypothetical protein ABZ401_19210 [Streptomyces sp. NPDC005892]|uniref:hypothetical protein n=1 Tax=Streptomyces sp. NPDC005892 TaxID=3155593 RepID=UPI0033DB37A4